MSPGMICPYCRTEIIPGESVPAFCGGCGTPHHKECYDENGGCTLFGCKEAPPDEPKVQVTNVDVVSAAPWAAPYPPPPMQGSFPGPPPMQPTGFGDVSAAPMFGGAAGFPRMAPSMPPPGAVPPPPPPSPGVAGVPAATYSPPPMASGFGYATPGGILSVPQYAPLPVERLGKSRTAFLLLGIFLGFFGAHNLFAGFVKRGIFQLCLTLGALFTAGYASWMWLVVFGTWIWAIVDICTIDHDNAGLHFT